MRDSADSLGVEVIEPVEPLTHYSVARLVRDFRKGQSGLGVIGTSAFRQLDDTQLEFLRSRSLASGVNGWHRFGKNRYEARAVVIGTTVHGSKAALALTQNGSVHRFQRPDASHLDYDTTLTTMNGWGSEGSVQKIAGDWFGGLTYGLRSPGLELNDAGYNTSSDNWYLTPSWNYRSFKQGKYLRNWSTGVGVTYGRTFGGETLRSIAEYRANVLLRNFWAASFVTSWWGNALSPSDLRGGPALMNAAYTDATLRISSNGRKRVSGTFQLAGLYAGETAERRLNVSQSIVIRPSTAVNVSITPSATWNRDADQYIRTVTVGGVRHYLMGHLDQTTAALTARVSYVFTPQLALDVYAQPFLSSGSYSTIREVVSPKADEFKDRFATFGSDRLTFDKSLNRYSVDLQRDGTADFVFANPDFSVRQLRANTVLRWQYRPGSTIYLVWSQARDNGLLNAGLPVRRELDRLFSTDARNVFLVKASYWIGR